MVLSRHRHLAWSAFCLSCLGAPTGAEMSIGQQLFMPLVLDALQRGLYVIRA